MYDVVSQTFDNEKSHGSATRFVIYSVGIRLKQVHVRSETSKNNESRSVFPISVQPDLLLEPVGTLVVVGAIALQVQSATECSHANKCF